MNRINVIHVAGTKGKGTTCAYVDSILSAYQSEHNVPSKIGLFTSPHIMQVRERIQINSTPISRSQFARYFYEVWNALSNTPSNLHPNVPASEIPKPVYFRFLTLLSLHVFIQEGVDAAIYEVGVGGLYDSTNIFASPAVCGISKLGIDHVELLGSTIEEISAHKAGIFKTGTPAFSVPQVPGAQQVIESRAAEKEVELKTVPIHPALYGLEILPNADFQRQNASLAIALSSSLLEHIGQPPIEIDTAKSKLPEYVVRGVEDIRWRGRCEIKHDEDGKTTWYLDGAHTADSLSVAASWFGTQVNSAVPVRVLVFNQQDRQEGIELLKRFKKDLEKAGAGDWTHVIFCTNVTWKSKGYSGGLLSPESFNNNTNTNQPTDLVDKNHDPNVISSMTTQKAFQATWREAGSSAEIKVVPTLEEVVDFVHGLAAGKAKAQVLVTGSFRHMGGILTVLEGED